MTAAVKIRTSEHRTTNGGLFTPRTFSRRTRQRFAGDRRRELVRHLGREPSYPELIIISRIIAVEWELCRVDARIDAGDELSGHAMRARLAAENRLRLDLRELGLRPTAPKPPSLAEYLAAKDRAAAEAAA